MMSSDVKLGLIPANRDFFSDELARQMRAETIAALTEAGLTVVVPSEAQTKIGCVETREEAVLCGRLFRDEEVDGIVVAAVNFGDEQGVASAIREARLDVPILIFGCQEEETLTLNTPRRDAFCGLISIAEALRQIGARYTVARRPICFPREDCFAEEIARFTAVCRVLRAVRTARYGQVGVRPDGFWTCRTDEKTLQLLGPTVVTVDLSEIMAAMAALGPDAPEVRDVVGQMEQAWDCSSVAEEALPRMARLECALRQFAEENALDALAVECWSSLQENAQLCACGVLSRLGEQGLPCACETDVLGAMSMHLAALAGGVPAGLADWNNLHNEDDELVNLWHCGAFPSSLARERPRLITNVILGEVFGEDCAPGSLAFRFREQPVTLFRLSHEPETGFMAAVGHGQIESDPAETFGSYGWCRIPGLIPFYRDTLLRHFPHHVVLVPGQIGPALWEACGNYLGAKLFAPGRAAGGQWTPEPPASAGDWAPTATPPPSA